MTSCSRLLPVFLCAACLGWTLTVRSGDENLGLGGQTGEAPAPNVLVLRNGRLVEGRLSRGAGGYMVRLSKGSMLVPYAQVRFAATDRSDAYRQLRRDLPASARGRVAVARWCLTYKMHTQCRAELEAALRDDPKYAPALSMLKRLDELIVSSTKTSAFADGSDPRAAAPEARSLAGLSRDAARRYVAQVQPLLMNGCAGASCHGPGSSNGFRLERVRIGRGAQRHQTEQNLATVLKQIDSERPLESPLLVKAMGNHGRRGRPVFRGSAGARQLGVIRSWVAAVAVKPSTGVGQRRTIFDPQPAPATGSRRSKDSAAWQTTPAMRAARNRIEKKRIVRDLHEPTRPKPAEKLNDPFDPAEFNRKSPRPGTSK